MKNTKVIIAFHIVLMALIIAAFLPALNISSEGYQAKTVVMSAQTIEAVTEGVATKVVAESESEPEPVDVTEEVVTEEQAPSVIIEETVEEAIAHVEPEVNEIVSTIETPASVIESAVISEPESATDALYTVVDGNKLDAHSYAGFKLYRNWCARCHGTYGQGMVGPNLADSLKIIDEDEFYQTVEKGKSGTIGSMPAWRANVKVMEGRDKLYAYLKARSDGAIGVEKPKKQ